MAATARRRLPVLLVALLAPLAALLALRGLGGLGGDGRARAHEELERPRAAALDPRRGAELAEPPSAAEAGRGEAALPRAPAARAPDPPAAPPPRTGIALVDPDGAPVAGARWAAFRGDALLAHGETGEDGLAHLDPPAAERFTLAVVPPGLAPLLVELEPDPDRRAVELGRGAAIAGLARVDGGVPETAIRLRVAGEPLLRPADLPEAAAEVLLPGGRAVEGFATTTDPDGRFRLAGLPAGWTGTLAWSVYPLAGSPSERRRQIDVVAPREDLLLDLVSLPTLVGVVVDPATGEPVPRPAIRAEDGSSTRIGTYGEDGTFRMHFGDALPEQLVLEVATHDGGGARRHTVEIPPGMHRFDTGPLAIAWTRAVPFRVRASGGGPIEGAAVDDASAGEELDDLRWNAPRSDASGEGTVTVGADAVVLIAEAAGYQRATAPLPPWSPEPVTEPVLLELLPGTVLELVLPDGARDLGVVLFGAENPFLRNGVPGWEPARVSQHTEATVHSSSDGYVEYRGAKDGRYLFEGLRPGVAVDVAAVDAAGMRIGRRRVSPLASGERRVVELSIERELGVLSGRVVTPAGEPVPRARISVSAAGSVPDSLRIAGADGRFEIDGLAAREVDLVVTAAGFPSRRLTGEPVNGPPIEVVLGPGREVRIQVVDALGRPVSGVVVRAREDGDAWWYGRPEEREPGLYVVSAAPLGRIPFEVVLVGRRIPGAVEEDADLARVVLPPTSRCTFELVGSAALLEDKSPFVEIRGSEPDAWLHLARIERGALGVAVEHVLPGRYQARVRGSGPGGSVSLSETASFEVTPELPARVRLELREP